MINSMLSIFSIVSISTMIVLVFCLLIPSYRRNSCGRRFLLDIIYVAALIIFILAFIICLLVLTPIDVKSL